MRWRGWANAEIYDAFVRSASVYRWLNERLVARAGLEAAERVLDLGCGTGATAAVCLGRLPYNADLVGVDASPEMIAVARANTMDPRARFVVGDAGAADTVVEGPFDRVVSNAAIWQFGPIERTLGALARVCVPGARVVFDVPAARFTGEAPAVHPFQIALARGAERRLGRALAPETDAFGPERLEQAAGRLGYTDPIIEHEVWSGPQRELAELMAIPAMGAALDDELTDEQLAALVAEARAAVDLDATVDVPWVFLSLRFRGPRARSERASPPT